MNRIVVLAVAILATLAMALPVVAQDQPTSRSVGLAYVDEEIDGPIANALARLDQHRGYDTTALRVEDLFSSEGPTGPNLDCFVVVGQDGDKIASAIGWTRTSVRTISAQGATRHETAVLAADAVAECNG